MVGEVIAAIATPIGQGGIGIVRLSGARVLDVLARVCSRPIGKEHARRSILADVTCPESGARIEQALFLYMPGPRSYTGEEVAEISCHGGRQAMRSVLEAVLKAGARLAEPGEFTERAFLNGRLDLSQAEAVADVIEAGSEAAFRAAQHQLRGGLSRAVGGLAARLREVLALAEAYIDFPQEELPEDRLAGAEAILAELLAEVTRLRGTHTKGRLVREGVRLVLVGRPNVGKSSLLNRLLGRPRAIVTEVAGTTRDLLCEPLELEGIAFSVVDTAGIRRAQGPVESEGLRLAGEAVADADVAVLLFDRSTALTDEDALALASVGNRPVIPAANKADLPPAWGPGELSQRFGFAAEQVVELSALTGEGVGGLLERLVTIARVGASAGDEVLVTSVRHDRLLAQAEEALIRAGQVVRGPVRLELLAADLRQALHCLGRVTGAEYDEDLLGDIFGRFCIGK
jgi:tRNA modification GTPase